MAIMRARVLRAFVAAALLAAGASAAVDAKGPPDDGGEEGYGNNLSIPTLFVPDNSAAPALRIPGTSEATSPVATDEQPVWHDEITFYDQDGNATVVPAGWYYEQQTDAAWQATWDVATSAAVMADWGDNLTDAPKLKARQPIRVEMTLYQMAQDDQGALVRTTGTGFRVYKLTDELDRLATYGTDGAAVTNMPVRVFEAGATLSIQNVDTGAWVLGGPDGGAPMSAEINSVGGIVYGFNWGIQGRKSTPAAGTYQLTFETVGTSIVAIEDADALRVPTFDTTSTTLTITLVQR